MGGIDHPRKLRNTSSPSRMTASLLVSCLTTDHLHISIYSDVNLHVQGAHILTALLEPTTTTGIISAWICPDLLWIALDIAQAQELDQDSKLGLVIDRSRSLT